MRALPRCALICAALGIAAAFTGSAWADNAKQNYRLYCMGCHQIDGTGSPENGIPSLKNEVGQFLRLPEGRAYLSQVPGVLNTPLNDTETAELLTWVATSIGRADLPSGFHPYTAEEVSSYRAGIPSDILAVRMRLLQKLAERPAKPATEAQ